MCVAMVQKRAVQWDFPTKYNRQEGTSIFYLLPELSLLIAWEIPQGLKSHLQIPRPSRKLLPVSLRNVFWPPKNCGIYCSMSFLLVWIFFCTTHVNVCWGKAGRVVFPLQVNAVTKSDIIYLSLISKAIFNHSMKCNTVQQEWQRISHSKVSYRLGS